MSTDELRDELLAYLDEGVRPITAAEARAVAGTPVGRAVAGARAARRRPKRALVGVLLLLFSSGVVVVTVLATSFTRTVGVLLATSSGPCAGAAPGCGSAQSGLADLAAGRWTTFPSGPLSPRTGQAEVWTGRELIIWGGITADLVGLANGAAYNPARRTWMALPPSPLAGGENAAAAWTGSEMIVVGGDAGGGGFDDAAAYVPASNSWRALPAPPLGGVTRAVAIWTGRQLVVIGGAPSAGSGTFSPYASVYDPAMNTWAALPDLPLAGGSDLTGVEALWTGDELVASEASTQTADSFVSGARTGFALAAGATTWRAISASLLAATGEVTWTGPSWVAVPSCQPGTSCGFVAAPVADADMTGRWSEQAPLPIGGQLWPAVWTGRLLLASAGGSALVNHAGLADRLVAFDPSSGRWVTLPAPLPAALANGEEQAVWTGTALLVWGTVSEAFQDPGAH